MSTSLDQELLQAVSTECACFNLRRTTRAITQLYDQALAGSGLRATQVILLVALARAGGVPASRLTMILGMDKTTLSRNLLPLRRAKLIEDRAGADRRIKFIALTAKGTAALSRALPVWEGTQRRITTRLGAEQWTALRHDLERLTTIAKDSIS